MPSSSPFRSAYAGAHAIASWVFGVFFLNGILTTLICWLYRQPWPSSGPSRHRARRAGPRPPVVPGGSRAFFATGVFILVLGLTGWVRRAMDLIPMPIVMAMVAGSSCGPAPTSCTRSATS
jgi:benzoate membrane transport protein